MARRWISRRVSGVSPPMRGLKASAFLQKISGLEGQIAKVVSAEAAPRTIRLVAYQFVLRDLDTLAAIDGLLPEEVQEWFTAPGARAAAAQVAKSAALAGRAARARRAAAASPPSASQGLAALGGGASASAHAAAVQLGEFDFDVAGKALQSKAAEHGIAGLGQGLKPRKAVEAVAAAQNFGWNPQEVLRERVGLLKAEARQSSLPGTASALKAWHLFAVNVLGYEDASTLPPKVTGARGDVPCYV